MRTIALALLLLAVLICVAAQADKGPLVAGTAKGPMSVASKQHVKGVHYPLGPMDPHGYYLMNGSHPKPFNGTFPYSEWTDKARVRGHRPAMSREYVIVGSKKRN